MSKSKSIIAILLIVLCSAFFGYMDVKGIGDTKAGSAEEIKLGLDLAGGVSITYQVVGEENPSSQDMADTINKLQHPAFSGRVASTDDISSRSGFSWMTRRSENFTPYTSASCARTRSRSFLQAAP